MSNLDILCHEKYPLSPALRSITLPSTKRSKQLAGGINQTNEAQAPLACVTFLGRGKERKSTRKDTDGRRPERSPPLAQRALPEFQKNTDNGLTSPTQLAGASESGASAPSGSPAAVPSVAVLPFPSALSSFEDGCFSTSATTLMDNWALTSVCSLIGIK
jgi:hypothetical protein